jgi:hypothetical protein
MADTIGNLASGQLLTLLAVPLLGAVLLTAFIVLAISRRRKKPQMKLGIQPKKASQETQPAPAEADEAINLDTSILSQLHPTPEPSLDLNTDILSREPSPQIAPPDTPVIAEETETSGDLTPDESNSQTLAADAPPQPVDKVSLTDRVEPPPPVPPAAPASDTEELLRLARHSETGELVVQVAGQNYTKLTDITDKKIGQYILKLTAHLLSFTNGMIETEAGLKSVYNPKLGPPPEPIASSPTPTPAHPEPSPVPGPSPEVDAALLASLMVQPTQPEEPQPRRGLFGRRSRTGPQPILPSLNLADEINKIVQARLLASPLAATTNIEITDDLSGGIRIRVNGIPYASPDDIPEAEVQELIRASIKQWERL